MCYFFPMRIALAQITPILGDLEKNFERHRQYIENARQNKVDLLVFPELSLTGYSLKDLTPEVALHPQENPYFQEFKERSRDIAFVIGFVEEKQRGLLYNASAYFSGGELLHVHRKVFLPTYGMFEESKFFAQGKNVRTFSTPFGPTGMAICYDFLHLGTGYLLFAGGAEIILTVSAAPGRGISEHEAYGSSHMWELMGEALSRFSTSFVIYCNRVGIEDGVTFAGGSFIYDPSGKQIARAPLLDEDFLIRDIDLEDLRTRRRHRTYKRDDKPEIVLTALQRIIADHED